MVMNNDARTDHPARPQGHAGQAEDFWGKGRELRRDPSTSHGNRGGKRVLRAPTVDLEGVPIPSPPRSLRSFSPTRRLSFLRALEARRRDRVLARIEEFEADPFRPRPRADIKNCGRHHGATFYRLRSGTSASFTWWRNAKSKSPKSFAGAEGTGGSSSHSRVLFGVAGDTLVHEAARRFRCHSPIPTTAIPTATNGKPIPRSSGWIPATRYETRTACPQYWNPSPWARTR